MRFTLGKLFLAIAMLALACAGMMYRTRWWSAGILSFTFTLYVIIGLIAIGLPQRQRTAAVAFSFIGGGYVLFITCSANRNELVTNDPLALIALAAKLPGTVLIGVSDSGATITGQLSAEDVVNAAWPKNTLNVHPRATPELHSFFLIGHCVWSWLFAVLAAWFTGRMYDRRERAAREAT